MMFDHLDDPDGFDPTPEFRDAVHRRGGRLRRRNRLALLGTSLVGCVVLATTGIGVALDRRLDRVNRVEVDSTSGVEGFDQPFNVLVVGTDGRPGVDGVRADTIIVVRIVPATAEAAVLALPRDLHVPIAGTDREDRISQAVAAGPDALVATVEALGIPVDHYVSIGMDGMTAMVDGVGGVHVDVPAPMRDGTTGLDVGAGCSRLGGRTVLALARSRHVETYVDGAWRSDPPSDLGRIQRQVLLGRIMLLTINRFGRNPADLNRFTRIFADNATVDSGLSNRGLVEFARIVQRIEPEAVIDLGLPVEPASLPGGAEVLVLGGEWTAQREILDGTKPDLFSPGLTRPSLPPLAIGPC
jgi:LCP family protein required for cell wall assembly